MKRLKIPLVAILLSVVLLGSYVFSAAPKNEVPSAQMTATGGYGGPPTDIPGWIFKGRYIKVGINKMGTLGVGEEGADPGVGFQFPIGQQYESLAIWWWGEGFKLAYKAWTKDGWTDRIAYYQPAMGYPAPSSSNLRLIRSWIIHNDVQKAVVKSELWTLDYNLRIVLTWTFMKDYTNVFLDTKIENMGFAEIRDVVYTRVVDWDIHQHTGGNIWFSDANSAWAKQWNPELGDFVVCGVSGSPHVEDIDLYAWDDWTKPFLGDRIIKDFQAPVGDYCAGIYYYIDHQFMPNEIEIVRTVYNAGSAPPTS
jgi:hypothetical protein